MIETWSCITGLLEQGAYNMNSRDTIARHRWPASILLLAVVLAFAANQGAAQTLYGELVGNIRDTSDAAVPGASVTITNVNTSQSRQTVTNDVGAYTFATVDPGTYTVRVTKEGFSTTSESDVVVSINNITRVNLTLKVGVVSESV